MPPKEVLWDLDPHTLAKHHVLREYLKRWLAILSQARFVGKIAFVDAFCGPGEYKTGDHTSLGKCKFLFYFLDTDKRRLDHLEAKLAELSLPASCQVGVKRVGFEEEATRILSDIESRGANMAPTFWFLDPFGFDQIPLEVIARISRQKSSEVFIHVMTRFFKRFLEEGDRAESLTRLFGCSDWTDHISKDSPSEDVIAYYIRRLGESTRFKFFLPFGLKPPKADWQHLVFGTQHPKGFVEMKSAMWKVDATGAYQYRANAPRYSPEEYLFDVSEIPRLRRLIMNRFGGQTDIPIETIKKYVDEETLFVADSHLKRKTLTPMEKDGLITYVEGRSKAGSFNDGCKVSFAREFVISAELE